MGQNMSAHKKSSTLGKRSCPTKSKFEPHKNKIKMSCKHFNKTTNVIVQ